MTEWLSLLQEPVLVRSTEPYAGVRILYDFALRNRPRAVIRVTREAGNVTLIAKVAETRSVDDQGRLMWIRTRALTDQDWKRVEELVDAGALWTEPTISEREITTRESNTLGQDPLCYLVELARGDEQRVLYDCLSRGSRSSPLVTLLEQFAKCS